jgi:phosphoglycerate dehydrogenase-like enzyme
MRSDLRLLVFAGDSGYYRFTADGVFAQRLRELGELTVAPADSPDLAGLLRDHEVLISHHATPLAALAEILPEVARNPGRLKYVACTHGGCSQYAPLLDAGIALTNWGDHAGQGLAVLSLTLLLALLRELPTQIDHVRGGGWSLQRAGIPHVYGGSAAGLQVGVYGMGAAGRAFLPLAQPLGVSLAGFDPYAEPWPEGVERAASLAELCTGRHALIVLAALTDETRGTLTGDLLARLPDGGIVINVARGAIIEQDALFAELHSGRLRAGLDVLEPDYLPPEHPVRQLPNCVLTCHVGPENRLNRPPLERNEQYCLDNLRRYLAGEPLQWVIDRLKLSRMT